MTFEDKILSTGVLEKQDKILSSIISANPSPSGKGGRPPKDLTGCHIILGGRRIDNFFAGTLLQFRHLYIDTYKDPSDFALIEAGPIGPITGGITGAWIKDMDWDSDGIQWDITPKEKCVDLIECIKRKTAEYHAATYPYNYDEGPNSNSFVWWVLNQCGIDISFIISSWPYRGIDYWQNIH